ncbi:MAG TPA: alpha-L-rhamnosidase C-terminal domain-containing protein [Fimbriimonas sp.]
MRLRAEPVWAEGDRPSLHDVVGFKGRFEWEGDRSVNLRIACSSVYRAWLNGELVAHGPARCAKGFFRLDEWELTDLPCLFRAENVVAVEVVHYGVNSYAMIDQPAFLLAEVLLDGQPVLWTHPKQGGFRANEVPGRLRKVARYSFQRPFSEAYRLAPDWEDWRTVGDEPSLGLVYARAGEILHRHAPLPSLQVRQPRSLVATGTLTEREHVELRKDRSITAIGEHLKGCEESELEVSPMLDLQRFSFARKGFPLPYDPGATQRLLPSGTLLVDFGINQTGLVGARISCREKARLVLAFDEVLTEGGVDHLRLGCANAVQLEMEPGEYAFEAAEPYTFRYLEFVNLEGTAEVGEVTLREIAHPGDSLARFACSDPRLNRIFQAAVETFRQNAVDIFMDCPSRERAGWLCDSYFTARAASLLSGGTSIEHDFLENFALPEAFDNLPRGMVPMCYPADHLKGEFIPQWGMWFVLQVADYLARSGDTRLVRRLKPKVEGLVEFFAPYRNENGLLEDLPSWNFIEWSKANEWVHGVNYPTNMLYAATLEAASGLLGRPELREQAREVRREVRSQSYDGRFFVDNAVRQEGRLAPMGHRSEVCQYFAFFFGTATPESHPELWRTLLEDFGPERRQSGKYPQVAPANMFVGEVLRLELLARAGRSEQVCEDLVGYLHQMALTTGTLWENNNLSASANHGFASHAAVWILGQALGLKALDVRNRTIDFAPPESTLEWCEARIPTPDGPIEIGWSCEKGSVVEDLRLPAGYRRATAATSPSP